MISVGNDIVENYRIAKTLARFGKRFTRKIYSSSELSYCLEKKNPIPFLAARFALKEAFIKAMELAENEFLEMKEIELEGTTIGKKRVVIHGKAEEMFQKKGFTKISASVSHSKEYSTAVVILYK